VRDSPSSVSRVQLRVNLLLAGSLPNPRMSVSLQRARKLGSRSVSRGPRTVTEASDSFLVNHPSGGTRGTRILQYPGLPVTFPQSHGLEDSKLGSFGINKPELFDVKSLSMNGLRPISIGFVRRFSLTSAWPEPRAVQSIRSEPGSGANRQPLASSYHLAIPQNWNDPQIKHTGLRVSGNTPAVRRHCAWATRGPASHTEWSKTISRIQTYLVYDKVTKSIRIGSTSQIRTQLLSGRVRLVVNRRPVLKSSRFCCFLRHSGQAPSSGIYRARVLVNHL